MKKILGISVITMAVAVFITTKSVDQSANVRLADMTSLNSANAECPPYTWNDGVCTWGGNCFWDPYVTDCSPY